MLALLRLLFVSALLFAALLPGTSGAQAVPPVYTLHVLAVADTSPNEFVWVVEGNLGEAYKSLDSSSLHQ